MNPITQMMDAYAQQYFEARCLRAQLEQARRRNFDIFTILMLLLEDTGRPDVRRRVRELLGGVQ